MSASLHAFNSLVPREATLHFLARELAIALSPVANNVLLSLVLCDINVSLIFHCSVLCSQNSVFTTLC